VRVARTIGVDPIAPRPNLEAELKRPNAQYFATTSNEFFERHAAEQLALGVDVVFIDALRTYDQTRRDVRNALKVLRPGGVILVHDCLPTSAQEAVVAPSYEEAWRINGPGWNGA
jgi:Methyltransferase domain